MPAAHRRHVRIAGGQWITGTSPDQLARLRGSLSGARRVGAWRVVHHQQVRLRSPPGAPAALAVGGPVTLVADQAQHLDDHAPHARSSSTTRMWAGAGQRGHGLPLAHDFLSPRPGWRRTAGRCPPWRPVLRCCGCERGRRLAREAVDSGSGPAGTAADGLGGEESGRRPGQDGWSGYRCAPYRSRSPARSRPRPGRGRHRGSGSRELIFNLPPSGMASREFTARLRMAIPAGWGPAPRRRPPRTGRISTSMPEPTEISSRSFISADQLVHARELGQQRPAARERSSWLVRRAPRRAALLARSTTGLTFSLLGVEGDQLQSSC